MVSWEGTLFQMFRYTNIVKYWVKILHTDDNKYIRKVYNMLINDMEVYPDKSDWCTLLNDLLCTLGSMMHGNSR